MVFEDSNKTFKKLAVSWLDTVSPSSLAPLTHSPITNFPFTTTHAASRSQLVTRPLWLSGAPVLLEPSDSYGYIAAGASPVCLMIDPLWLQPARLHPEAGCFVLVCCCCRPPAPPNQPQDVRDVTDAPDNKQAARASAESADTDQKMDQGPAKSDSTTGAGLVSNAAPLTVSEQQQQQQHPSTATPL